MANSTVADVAHSSNPLLKVKSDSKPNTVAGAICNVVREARGNHPPSILATGPAAINQAMKAIAIARKYLLDEGTPIDLLAYPKFEQVPPSTPPPPPASHAHAYARAHAHTQDARAHARGGMHTKAPTTTSINTTSQATTHSLTCPVCPPPF